MKKLILLLIVGNIYANIQLVNGDEVVVLKRGKKFSINDDKTNYRFEFIDLGGGFGVSYGKKK